MGVFPSCGVDFWPLLCHFCGDIKRTKQHADSGWKKKESEIKSKHWKPEKSFTGVKGKIYLKWYWEQQQIWWNLINAFCLRRTGYHSAVRWHHSLLLPYPATTHVIQPLFWTACSQTTHSMDEQTGKCSKYPLNVYLPSKVSKLHEAVIGALPLWESILYYPLAGIIYK